MKYIVGGYSQLSYGSSDICFEHLLTRQLRPILTMLYNNPSLKYLLRLSIAEFEWLDKNHPEINMLINDLCKKGQLELLSSSYYDADLGMVPTHERSLHIESTTTYLRKHFTKHPHGLWFNYQIFNPSIVPVMELSSLDYIVISTYNQNIKDVLNTKPFCIAEMGKKSIVFPTDDKISRLVVDSIKAESKSDKLCDDVKKTVKSSTNAFNTYFFNIDLLSEIENSNEVFSIVYKTAGSNSILPSEYIEEHDFPKYFYLPSGVYGHDYTIGKACSINQKILDSSIFSKSYFTLDFLRNLVRTNKKNIINIKLIDELLLEASSSTLYIPSFSSESAYRRYVSNRLCEVEKLLSNSTILPQVVDVSSNNNLSYVSITKNLLAYINSKGSSISKLCYLNSNFDFVLNSESGLFYDDIKSINNSKVTNISNKKFDISVVDKKHSDFICSCSSIEFDGNELSLTKKYKFRQNYFVIDFEVLNKGKTVIKDYVFETFFNLSFDKDPNFKFDSSEVLSFDYSSKNYDLNLFVNFDTLTNLTSKSVFSNASTVVGTIQDYQYTQFKIDKTLSLQPMETLCFSVMIKLDKYKEKNNDIKQ